MKLSTVLSAAVLTSVVAAIPLVNEARDVNVAAPVDSPLEVRAVVNAEPENAPRDLAERNSNSKHIILHVVTRTMTDHLRREEV